MRNNIALSGKTILITGCPGFIGATLTKRLVTQLEGAKIVAIDNLNDYYDVSLKMERLSEIYKEAEKRKDKVFFEFVKGDISDRAFIDALFEQYDFEIVVHLAAQAGVRYSISHPEIYINTNIVGFFNILEACRKAVEKGNGVFKHLVFASSSSVYGANNKVPFSTDDKTDSPVSLYAATKKSDELLGHAYAKLYDIPMTGLRFFTVYGPCGRPDMFYFAAAEKMANEEIIEVYNNGDMMRDFTYIDDVVEGVTRVMANPPEKETGKDGLPIAPFKVYNIGGGNPKPLMLFITALTDALKETGAVSRKYAPLEHIKTLPMQHGDVKITYSDTKSFEKDFGYVPETQLRDGLYEFARWFAEYRKRGA